jgi:hypothetical protein
VEAVHELDRFVRHELPTDVLIDLGKGAIDWWMPTARPHTTEQWEELLDDLDVIRGRVVMIEGPRRRLAGSDSPGN